MTDDKKKVSLAPLDVKKALVGLLVIVTQATKPKKQET